MAKEKTIRVCVKRADETEEMVNVTNELKDLQALVGGYIQPVSIGAGILMVCDEEGKCKGSTPNLDLGDDIIVGDVFFCGIKDGEFTSLSIEQQLKLGSLFMDCAIYSED